MSSSSLRPVSDYWRAKLAEAAERAKVPEWELTPTLAAESAPSREEGHVLSWAAAQGHAIRWEGDDAPVTNGAARTILPLLAALFETHEGVLPSPVEYAEAWRDGLPGLPVSPARYAVNHDRYKSIYYTLKLALGADGLDEAIVTAGREGSQP